MKIPTTEEMIKAHYDYLRKVEETKFYFQLARKNLEEYKKRVKENEVKEEF